MTTISTDTVKRLLKDVKQIIKTPLEDNGIYYKHCEENMLKGYALIIGPKDTPYFGGYYFFEFNYPDDYPFSPPKVTYKTNDGLVRYNPNLYKCGKVCVSILNTWSGDKWSSCQTITSVLLTLCSLLNDAPLTNEPGHNKNCIDFLPYQKTIEYKNIDFAICDLLNYDNIPPSFKLFYPIMIENFMKNYDELCYFISKQPKEEIIYNTKLYQMNIRTCYEELQKKIENTMTQLKK